MNKLATYSTPSTHLKHYYRPEIDGLRALAVIAVVVNHLNSNVLPSGYLGVDIFFVISGFVITASLAGNSRKNLSDFVIGFYARRIKRLIPALVFFVAINSILICLFNPNPRFSIETGLASLFGFSNLYLLKASTDYFAPSTELNVFVHTWSLGVEQQFYLLFPFLVWFSGFRKTTQKGAKKLIITTGILSVASLISFIYLNQVDQPAAYFLTSSRLWEIGAGCLLFMGTNGQNNHIRRTRFFFGFLDFSSLAILISIAATLFMPVQFTVLATVSVVLLTTILIAYLRPDNFVCRLLSCKLITYIGVLSYSLYLWHWAVIALSHWTIGVYWWSLPFQITIIVLCLLFRITLSKPRFVVLIGLCCDGSPLLMA